MIKCKTGSRGALYMRTLIAEFDLSAHAHSLVSNHAIYLKSRSLLYNLTSMKFHGQISNFMVGRAERPIHLSSSILPKIKTNTNWFPVAQSKSFILVQFWKITPPQNVLNHSHLYNG